MTTDPYWVVMLPTWGKACVVDARVCGMQVVGGMLVRKFDCQRAASDWLAGARYYDVHKPYKGYVLSDEKYYDKPDTTRAGLRTVLSEAQIRKGKIIGAKF